MKGLLIVTLCVVYSAQAWKETLGPLHIEAESGFVPMKYYPMTADDLHATRKAGAFVSFIKVVPQLNPLKLASLGPYSVFLPEVNFQGELLLTNIAVHGLKTLSLSGLEVRMNPARLDFNVSVPQVSADVDFQLHTVWANQPLTVNGQVSATVYNLAAAAAVGPKVAYVGPTQVYQVDSADVVVELGELQLDMDMNQYSEEFRVLAVQFLQNTQQYANIVNDIARAVIKAVNNELTLLTAKEILQYLLGPSRPSLSG